MNHVEANMRPAPAEGPVSRSSGLSLLALAVLLVPALCSSAGRLAIAIQSHRMGVGNGWRVVVHQNLARFSQVSTALPSATVVGYLTDRPGFVESSEPADYQPWSLDSLMFVRFGLLPLILAPNSQQAIVVGDFKDPAAASALIQEKGFRVVKDFGNGVLLLRREDAR